MKSNAQVIPAQAGIHQTKMDSGLRRNDGRFAVVFWQSIWRTLRTLVGDDAYEQYCAHHYSHHPDQAPLDRRAFYEKNQTEKWSGIKRCC